MKSVRRQRSSIEAAASEWIARRDAGFTPADEVEFARWRAADARHAIAFARLLQTWSILDRPVRDGHAREMAHELRSRTRVRRRRARSFLGALALFIATIGWHVNSTGNRTEVSATGATAVVVQPERRLLPDGSVVELRAGAEIEIDFDGRFRRIALNHGEAHFQVRPDPEKPFVVSAGKVEFRAVGTAFSVQLRNAEVEVLVTEGRIAVEHPKPESPPAPPSPTVVPAVATQTLATIPAGNKLVLELASPESASAIPAAVSPEEMAERLAWRATWLEFTGTSLAEVVALMNRHNREQFSIADPSLAKVEVSGHFRADNIDAFLLLLEGSFDIAAQRSNGQILLRKSG